MEPPAKRRKYLKGMELAEFDMASVANWELDPNEDSQVLVEPEDPRVSDGSSKKANNVKYKNLLAALRRANSHKALHIYVKQSLTPHVATTLPIQVLLPTPFENCADDKPPDFCNTLAKLLFGGVCFG